MHTFQDKLIFIPFHQLTFHNRIPKELIFYQTIEEFTPDLSLEQPTLLTLFNVDSCYTLDDKEKVLQLVQNPNFVGLVLCTEKYIVIKEEIIAIFSQCEIPVIQIEKQSSLLVFQQNNELLYPYNNLGLELDGINEKGISQLATNLAKTLETPFLFLDNQYHVAWQSGTPQQLEKANKWLETHRKELIVSRQTHTHNDPIISNQQYLLFTLYVSESVIYSLLVANHLVAWQRQLVNKLVGLATLNNQTKLRIKNQLDNFKEHFIHDLLFNNFASQTVLIQQGESLGWNLKKPHHLLIVNIQLINELMTNLTWLDDMMVHFEMQNISLNEQLIIFQFQEQIIILLEDEEERTPLERKEFSLKIAKQLQETAAKKWPNRQFRIGVGNYYPEVDLLHKSYQEAILAIQFMQHWFLDKHVCHFNDLRVFRLLLYIPNEILYHFYEETLTVLINSDEKHETEYIKTLQIYFQKNGKINEVAEELYVHPNTLRNRIKKIEDITGLNLQEPEGCINLNIAMRILSFISSK